MIKDERKGFGEKENRDQLVVYEISKRELQMLKLLRQYKYGKIVIHKQNGLIIRVEPTQSFLITGAEETVEAESPSNVNV